MNREMLECIGMKDRTGKEIRNGDIFQYENMYIVTKDADTKEFFLREYENLVEYGVEADPYYRLIGTMELTDVRLSEDQVVDNIFCNKELQKQLHDEDEEE